VGGSELIESGESQVARRSGRESLTDWKLGIQRFLIKISHHAIRLEDQEFHDRSFPSSYPRTSIKRPEHTGYRIDRSYQQPVNPG
jgi:hypothetical protein